MIEEIETKTLQRVMAELLPCGADDGDIYLEEHCSEHIALEEGVVKHLGYSLRRGMGARVIKGEACGYASTDQLTLPSMLAAAKAAKSVTEEGGGRSVEIRKRDVRHLYAPRHPAEAFDLYERKAVLERMEAMARDLDPRVRQVFASIHCSLTDVRIVRMDGGDFRDTRPLVRINVSVVIEDRGKREMGSSGGGGRFDLARLIEQGEPERHVREAVRLAKLRLEAAQAPAGPMPVVLGPGWPGVLLHEAVGHGLEGDFNRKGTSVFTGKLGQRVAAKGVTVIDEGCIPERRGSLSIDDEGTTTKKNVLIEDGILVGYMLDRMNARLMGMAPTGNGRRESYAHPVLPRMTNTYMAAGKDDPKEILRDLKRGVYAVNFSGGQVDITSGKFVFTTSEAYLVENGEIQCPIKGATLIGTGHEVLRKVSRIGHDLRLDPGIGTCGKDGQSVPVGVGMPTVLVDELIVGGTEQ